MLVLGGSGFVGRHAVLSLLRGGASFYAERGLEPEAARCAAALTTIAATGNPEALSALAHALGENALLAGNAATALEQFEHALEHLGEEFERRHGLRVELDLSASTGDLPEGLDSVLYRAVRECLFNVVKHAGIGTARVVLERSAWSIRARVEDRGAGFDVAAVQAEAARAGRLGLAGLRRRVERAGGDVLIESAPGRGTSVELRLPCETENAESRI